MTEWNNNSKSDSRAYHFDRFVLCLRQRVIVVNDRPVNVEKRVFNLLAYLLEHRDRAVSKEELEAAVWRGRPLSETVLARSIMKARQFLGDDPERQEFIRTVRGFGYQFVAPVEVRSTPECEGVVRRVTDYGSRAAAVMRDRVRRSRVVSTVLTLAAVVIGVLTTQGNTMAPSGGTVELGVQPVQRAKNETGLELLPRRLTAILDRRLAQREWADTVLVTRDMDQPGSGGLVDDIPILRSAIRRDGAQYQLEFQVIASNQLPLSGRISGTNPRRLINRLVARLEEAVGRGVLAGR